MALLETGMAGGQLLKPTVGNLFRQRSTTPTATMTPQQAPQQQQTVASSQQLPTAQLPVATSQSPVPVLPAAMPNTPLPKQGGQQQTAIKPTTLSTHTPAAQASAYSYQHTAPKSGVLDKNYYSDLGFSTSKEKAENLREKLGEFETLTAERGAELSQYSEAITTATAELEKKVDNAWKDVATSSVTLGPTTWRVPKEAAIGLRESLSKIFYSSDPVPAGDLTLEEYKKKYAQDINIAAGMGAVRAYAADKVAEGTKQYDQYMPDKKKRDDAEAAAQKRFDEVAPTVYAQAKALNDQDSLNFTFDYRTSSKNRAKYYAIVNQVNPQISKMKLDYMRQFANQAAPHLKELADKQVEAHQAIGVLEADIAAVDADKAAAREKQERQRAGISNTLGSLFRQRSV